MLMNEIPLDSLMALADERRRRYTDEADRYRLARCVTRWRWIPRRHRSRPGAAGSAGTRVTAADHDLCA